MRLFGFFLSLLVVALAFAASAHADTNYRSQKPSASASVAVANTDFYDAATYDWPGDRRTGRTYVSSFIARPGIAVSPVVPFGDCVFIDNASQDRGAFSLPFTTRGSWDKFKSSPPDYLTLTSCCPRLKVRDPCGNAPRIIAADRIGTIRTLAFGPAYDQVYRCLPTASGVGSPGRWTQIGQVNVGGCTGSP